MVSIGIFHSFPDEIPIKWRFLRLFEPHCFTLILHNFILKFLISRINNNSWCSTPYQLKKTVSTTFIFHRTWRAFFQSWFIWALPFGWRGLCFDVVTMHQRFFMSFDDFGQTWMTFNNFWMMGMQNYEICLNYSKKLRTNRDGYELNNSILLEHLPTFFFKWFIRVFYY